MEESTAEIKSTKVEYKKVWCAYSFSTDEMVEIAKELAIKTQLIPEIENNAKKAAAQFKEQLLNAKSEQDTAARKYKDGYEMRDIECIVDRDFETGEVRFVRTDTGEVAKREKMTMAERQMTIDQAPRLVDQAPEDEAEHEAHIAQVNREMSSETSSF